MRLIVICAVAVCVCAQVIPGGHVGYAEETYDPRTCGGHRGEKKGGKGKRRGGRKSTRMQKEHALTRH